MILNRSNFLRRNYLYRSKHSTLRYVILCVLMQVCGTIAFVAAAILSAWFGVGHDASLLIAFVFVVVLMSLMGWNAHREDLSMVNDKWWPLDTIEQVRDWYVWAINHVKSQNTELVHLRKESDVLLTSNLALMKEAETRRKTHLLPKLQQNHNDVLRNRVDIIATLTRGRILLTKMENEFEVLNKYRTATSPFTGRPMSNSEAARAFSQFTASSRKVVTEEEELKRQQHKLQQNAA